MDLATQKGQKTTLAALQIQPTLQLVQFALQIRSMHALIRTTEFESAAAEHAKLQGLLR